MPPVSAHPSDLDIAQAATLQPIEAVAARMGLLPQEIERHGRHVAKVRLEALERLAERPAGKLIVVSAITPTPLGEGKTITTVGLGQALNRLGKTATIALRQPSMGPTFGVKGGAAGGGYSQVVPMVPLNLHLTGDMHAVTSANNLLAALIDNHLYHGNALGLDVDAITWRRCLDLNDRSLREVVTTVGKDGQTRRAGFDITAASEVMAILALCSGREDLRARLGRIRVGRTTAGTHVTAETLDGAGAMAVLLKDALLPNLLQTLEHTPALIHAGPFANIAPGVSSVLADRLGVHTADYLVTEAGFGADIGGEKFFNLKCRASGLKPAAVVLVTTIRALKVHTGRYRVAPGRPLPPEMLAENPDEVAAGAVNLLRHIDIVRQHGLEPVVAVNHFATDHPSELDAVLAVAEQAGVRAAVADHWARGGAGAEELARAVIAAADEPSAFHYLYDLDQPLRAKIECIATRLYRAGEVRYSPAADQSLDDLEARGHGGLPICMAKTHLSLTDDPKIKGAPEGFPITIREVRAALGAGFVTPLAGDIVTMPGLPSHPAAGRMDVDAATGQVVGLA